MDSIHPQLLNSELRKNQAPNLRQWLIGLVLIAGLFLLLMHFRLQDSIQHYQNVNQELHQQIINFEQLALRKHQGARPNPNRQQILHLLDLVTQHLTAGLFLTELHIETKNIILKGHATNSALVKNYVQIFAPRFQLDDFAFTHVTTQGIDFHVHFISS